MIRGLILAQWTAHKMKNSWIRRPGFLIRRSKLIFTATITPIAFKIRRPIFRNSPLLIWVSPAKHKQSKIPEWLKLKYDYIKANGISNQFVMCKDFRLSFIDFWKYFKQAIM